MGTSRRAGCLILYVVFATKKQKQKNKEVGELIALCDCEPLSHLNACTSMLSSCYQLVYKQRQFGGDRELRSYVQYSLWFRTEKEERDDFEETRRDSAAKKKQRKANLLT